MSSTKSTPVKDASPAAGRLGRRIGIGLFWSFLVYVIGMSAASIIPALYFPDLAPRPPAPAPDVCARELAALERDLLAEVDGTLRNARTEGLQRFLNGWDGRALALAGGCGPLEPARQALLTFREGVESMLATYRSDPLRAQLRLRSALTAYNDGRGQSPPPEI